MTANRARSQSELGVAEEIAKQFLAKKIVLNPLKRNFVLSSLKDGYYIGHEIPGDVTMNKGHLEEYIECLKNAYSSFRLKEQNEVRKRNASRMGHNSPMHEIDISIFKKEHDKIIRVNIEVNKEYSHHDKSEFVDYFKEKYENAIVVWVHRFLRQKDGYKNEIMTQIFNALQIP